MEQIVSTSWLENILKETFLELTRVISVETSPVTNKGENYASELLRLKVELQVNNTVENLRCSFILKKKNSEELWTDAESQMNSFHVEVKMFKKILPVVENLLKTAGFSVEESTIGPKCFGHSPDYDNILMNDLKEYGFNCVDKLKGWSFNEASMVIRYLARLHATSIVACNRKLLSHDDLERYCFGRDLQFIKNIYSNSFTLLAKVIENEWDSKWSKVAKWIRQKGTTFTSELRELSLNDPPNLIALNHGDIWNCNIMFKMDPHGEPITLRMVDFQISHFGSVGWDLNFYFYCDPSGNRRHDWYQSLIETYCAAFADCLHKFDSKLKGPSIEEVDLEINRLQLTGFLNVIGDLPHIMTPTDECLAYNDYLDAEDDAKIGIFRRSNYANLVKRHFEKLRIDLDKQ